MRKFGALFLMMFCLCIGNNLAMAAEKGDDLKKLGWLAGQWIEEHAHATYCERWQLTGSGSLDGSATLMNQAGKILLTEVLRIEKIGSHIVYIAAVNQNPPVLFTLIETGSDGQTCRWVFENQEHDFPQRIIYSKESAGSLLARVEGTQKGETKTEEFRLTRKK
jgi:hypothetical protein